MLENYGEVLRVGDVAEILGFGLTSVYDLLREGEIEGFMKKGKWLIPKESIRRFLNRNAYGKIDR